MGITVTLSLIGIAIIITLFVLALKSNDTKKRRKKHNEFLNNLNLKK